MPYTTSQRQATTAGPTAGPCPQTSPDAASTAPGDPPVIAPGTASSAFRVTCPGCGTTVVFPYNPATGVLLDWLLYLEEHLQDVCCPEATAVYEIVMALHALRKTLEVPL